VNQQLRDCSLASFWPHQTRSRSAEPTTHARPRTGPFSWKSVSTILSAATSSRPQRTRPSRAKEGSPLFQPHALQQTLDLFHSGPAVAATACPEFGPCRIRRWWRTARLLPPPAAQGPGEREYVWRFPSFEISTLATASSTVAANKASTLGTIAGRRSRVPTAFCACQRFYLWI
jgi:hypothetical protein